MRYTVIYIFLLGYFFIEGVITAQEKVPEDFNFIFMTDIHLEPGKRAPEGFKMAIDTANKLEADFVLTGGDLIADALEASYERSDSLYKFYINAIKDFNKPVYNTIGNHELCGLYRSSGVDTTDNDYNDGMYKRYFGNTYYSFDHKGWHFIVLKSIDDIENGYIGLIDQEQVTWLKEDLEKVDRATPIILVTHIPLITAYGQITKGALASNDKELVVNNSYEILQIFAGYNLKLALSGHLHIVEYIYLQNKIHFLAGGAVSGRWWQGPNMGMEEGFMYIRLRGGDVGWDYIDYKWDATSE
jgi:3',5'-cyclic AMP phosphodiesterase CpdA